MLGISGGSLNATSTYDPTATRPPAPASPPPTCYNKPAAITRGTTTLTFDHDPKLQRFRQVSPSGTTLYVAAGNAMAGASAARWSNYLMAGGQLIGAVIERACRPDPGALLPPRSPRLAQRHHPATPVRS